MTFVEIGVGGLNAVNLVTEYAMWFMMNYLTDVWSLDIVSAAIVVNIYNGVTGMLPVGIVFLTDCLLGHSWTSLISTLISTTGLGLLVASLPPVLATGNCSEYKPECMGTQQRTFFFVSLALISVGVSCYKASKETFEEVGTYIDETEEDVYHTTGCCKPFSWFAVTVVPIAGYIMMGFVKSWSWIFGIATACTILAAFVFLASFCAHIRQLGRRFAYSISLSLQVFKHFLFFLILFLPSALISSAGDTFFVAQAETLRTKLGPIPLPSTLLRYFSKENVVVNEDLVFSIWSEAKWPGLALSSNIMATLCCATAALVEAMRLGVVAGQGLIDKPDETVPMTILWLLPQYLLLSSIDLLVVYCMKRFLEESGRQEDGRYADLTADAVIGAGTLASGLSVYAAKVMTEKNGKTGWFGETLNRSRLDNYFWMLAIASFIHAAVWIFGSSLAKSSSLVEDAMIRSAAKTDQETQPLINQ